MIPVEATSTSSSRQPSSPAARLAEPPRHLEAVLAGQRVGVARIDQHGAHEAERNAAKMVPRHVHGRGAERVVREQRRAGAGYVSRHQRAVEAAATLVEARMHARKP